MKDEKNKNDNTSKDVFNVRDAISNTVVYAILLNHIS